MADNDAPSKVQHFLDTVLRKSGISKTKAGLLAGRFQSLESFKDADFGSLELKLEADKRISITEKDLANINKAKDHICPERDLVENWIKFTSHDTTKKIIRKMEELNLDDMSINPFLIRMLHLKTPKELLRFNVYQRISRSIVTIMGTSLEHMVADCGGERVKGDWYDVTKKDAKDTYLIQVKSGPSDVNTDQMRAFNVRFKDTVEKDPHRHPILGIAYGKPEQEAISLPMAKTYLEGYESSLLVGRELWDFMSGEKNYHRKILSWIDEAVSEDPKNRPIDIEIQKTINRLVCEFKSRYGDGEEAIQKYIDSII